MNMEKKHGIPLTVLLAILASGLGLLCLAGSGCRRGAPGKSIHVKYQASRPQWIEARARGPVPDALDGKRIDVIRIHKNRAYIGVRDYGIAIYEPRSDAWELYPYDYSRFNENLFIKDILPHGNAVYAGAAGGLLRLNLKTRAWTPFKNRRNPESNSIARMILHGNSLWLATSTGLYTFDTGSESFSLVKEGYFFNVAYAKGAVWCNGTIKDSPGTLYRFDPAARKSTGSWTPDPGLSIGIELNVESDRIVMPKANGQVFFRFADKKFEFVYKPDGFPEFLPVTMARYGEQYLMGSKSGLALFNPGKNDWLLITKNAGIIASNVLSLGVIGDLVFLGFPQGLMLVDKGLFAQIEYLARNPGAGCADACVAENSGAVNPWRLLDTSHGLMSNTVISLLPLEQGTWVGVHSLGISRVSGDSLEVKTFIPPGVKKNEVPATQILELAEKNGILWYGGDYFIGKMDAATGKWLTKPQTDDVLRRTNVEALWIGRGQVWAGVRKQGIRVLEKGRWRLYPGERILLSPYVTDIVHAEDALWISADFGLRRYNDVDDGFVYVELGGVMDIESMSSDGGAVLWIGCRERSAPPSEINTGLYRYNVRTRHMVRFNELDNPGLGDRVNKVFADGPFVWIAHEKGVSRYDRLTGEFTHFGAADGLEASEYLTVAVNADWLFVGTDQGLYARRILEFEDPAVRDQYRDAWHLARKGNHGRAAAQYASLRARAKSQHPEYADYLAWRASSERALAGDTDLAWRDFQPLLKKHPLLLLDLDTLAAARLGFDGYAQRLIDLRDSLPQRARNKRLAAAWLKHADYALEQFAKRSEKKGEHKAAERARRIAAKLQGAKQPRAALSRKPGR